MKYKEFLNSHEWRMKKEDAEPYVYIWAWHSQSGSMDYYIANLIDKAVKEKAPKNVTYYSDVEKCWHTIDDACEYTQNVIKEVLERA